MKGYIDNYEDLLTWFEATGENRWNLYAGFIDKFNQAHLLAKQEDGDFDKEESFALLKRMIGINSAHGGQFTIYVPQPGGRGFTTRMRVASAMMPGVGGFPAMQGNPYMLGMIPVNEVEERIRREKQSWELEKRIEELEAEKESSVGAVGQFMNKIAQEIDINNLLKMAVAVFGSRLNVNPETLRAVQLAGTPEEVPEGTGYTYDDPRILDFLDSIRSKFASEEEFYGFIGRVGQFFEKNSALALQFFNQNG